jgi:hypothetical protein
LQRLPRLRIERAQVEGKVVVDENPGAPCLGARDEAGLRTPAQFLRVHAQEGGGLGKRERLHGDVRRGVFGQRLTMTSPFS